MAYFPLYMEIEDKNCLVVGGGNVAERKAGQLLAFGASVIVVAPNVTKQLAKWSKEGEICLKQRKFLAEDLFEMTLVVAAANQPELHAWIAGLCQKEKIPINVVDDKALCTFFFPAIVKRKDVVVSVSTGGNSPALAAKLRSVLEKAVPDSYGTAAELMGRYRDFVMDQVENSEIRKQIFKKMLAEVLAQRILTEQDVKSFLQAYHEK